MQKLSSTSNSHLYSTRCSGKWRINPNTALRTRVLSSRSLTIFVPECKPFARQVQDFPNGGCQSHAVQKIRVTKRTLLWKLKRIHQQAGLVPIVEPDVDFSRDGDLRRSVAVHKIYERMKKAHGVLGGKNITGDDH